MKSRMTEGATRMRPAVVVCCVAIACRSSVSRAAYRRLAGPAPASWPPTPPRGGGGGRGEEARPRCVSPGRAARRDRLRLLDVAGLLHRGFRAGLGLGERLVDGHRAGESGREVLTDVGADALELGDRHELDARIGDRLHGRVVGVGRIDRLERELRPRRGFRIFWVLVERGAGSGWNAGPAVLRGDEFGVVLAGRPGD